MKDVIKVKVVKVGSNNWYEVGEVYEVENLPVKKWSEDLGQIALCYVVTDAKYTWLRAEHCEAVKPTLQEQLQAAKDNVAAIEKQIAAIAAEEAEKETSRPFTQTEYEAVVKAYRGCKGRVKFDDCDYNYSLEINSEGYVGLESWQSYLSNAPFGVFFGDSVDADAAIKEVGAENLRKAWQFEMNIGLVE